ncbi:MAG: FAD-dependent oxidoreductase [Bacteroidota bacterium]
MNFSYWEHKTWFSNIDFAVVGSGIVGLSCALSLRKKYPNSKIVVFEKGILPSGASTKNAGFACFGSVSELLNDLDSQSEEEVNELVKNRVEGLQLLRQTLGDATIGYEAHGGYEIFTETDTQLYEECLSQVPYMNRLLKSVFLVEKDVFSIENDPFSFKKVKKSLIFNHFEGQIDTGSMMRALIQKCSKNDISIINSAQITAFSSKNDQVSFVLNDLYEISASKLLIATNGFARQLLNEDVQPARAQVLITHPIANLKIKGTFHLDRGYYYFRNIDNRILFGGGRNLDFKGEETSSVGLTTLVQNSLETILRTTILPEMTFEIDTRWSGIMGVGAQKQPIVKELTPNVFCGVRLGGMGVAIGSSIGAQLAELI